MFVGQLECKVIRGKILHCRMVCAVNVNASGQCMDTWTSQFINEVSPEKNPSNLQRSQRMRCSSELQSFEKTVEITDQKAIKTSKSIWCEICVYALDWNFNSARRQCNVMHWLFENCSVDM